MGKKGMMALMLLMITLMAAIYIHIMWINRPIKHVSGGSSASSASVRVIDNDETEVQ